MKMTWEGHYNVYFDRGSSLSLKVIGTQAEVTLAKRMSVVSLSARKPVLDVPLCLRADQVCNEHH